MVLKREFLRIFLIHFVSYEYLIRSVVFRFHLLCLFSISCQSRGNSISSEFLLWSVAMMLFDRIGFVSFQLLCMLFDHFCVSFSWSVTQCPHLQSLLDILSVASILISNQLCVSFDYLYVLIRSFLFTFPSVKFESSLSLYSFYVVWRWTCCHVKG